MTKKIDYKSLVYKGLSDAYRQLGISYLGGINTSQKLAKGSKKNYLTYGIYLLSSNSSGYQVCVDDKHCKEHCLSTSGMAKIELLGGLTKIQNSRLKKTHLYSLNRDFFSQMVYNEIRKSALMAELDNNEFCVRINCSSDISLTTLKVGNLNLLQLFPHIQFYDYTKNIAYVKHTRNYKNLHLTFSYSGYNWDKCEECLKMGVNVAVVFDSKKLPKTFNGYKVINGDESDLRFLDEKNVIVGLSYKITAKDIKNNKVSIPETPFVVNKDDSRCGW